MKFVALVTLFTIASAHDLHGHHARIAMKRQVSSSVSASSAVSSSPTSSAASMITTTPLGAGTDIPPLSSIVSGAAPEATASLTATYSPGSQPPISGAPPIPTCTHAEFYDQIISRNV